MEKNKHNILCTRPVDAALVKDAVARGFDVDTIEFIETVAVYNDVLQQQVHQFAKQPHNVIFTSMNAVDAVINLLDNEKPFWKIFCMGNTTKKLVIKYFGEESLIATGINATDLANAIVEFQHSRFVTSRTDIENDTWLFFCGDQRRDELPGILNSNNISPTEIIVYKTIETSQEVEKYYDAILFFSPSAVHSFFKNNQADVATTFFAIGETTATAIKKYSSNTIITGNTPAKDELFKHCIHQLELQAELNTGNQ